MKYNWSDYLNFYMKSLTQTWEGAGFKKFTQQF